MHPCLHWEYEFFLGAVVSGLEFSNHGYNDLLVTISPDLPQDNAATIKKKKKKKIWGGGQKKKL